MRGDGSSNEERLKAGRKYRTDRTEGISDGVFAVSLTLLILDVRPPEGGVSQLVHGLVLIAPRLGTFALSFAINCSFSTGLIRLAVRLPQIPDRATPKRVLTPV